MGLMVWVIMVAMVPSEVLQPRINVRETKRIVGLEQITLPRHYRHRWGVRQTGIV
jgi:hypothetical protein